MFLRSLVNVFSPRSSSFNHRSESSYHSNKSDSKTAHAPSTNERYPTDDIDVLDNVDESMDLDEEFDVNQFAEFLGQDLDSPGGSGEDQLSRTTTASEASNKSESSGMQLAYNLRYRSQTTFSSVWVSKLQ